MGGAGRDRLGRSIPVRRGRVSGVTELPHVHPTEGNCLGCAIRQELERRCGAHGKAVPQEVLTGVLGEIGQGVAYALAYIAGNRSRKMARQDFEDFVAATLRTYVEARRRSDPEFRAADAIASAGPMARA
jgi:hypothetical protein